jgi:FkbM family methyltransferase
VKILLSNNSINFILKFRYRNKFISLIRYLIWWLRKKSNFFPVKIGVGNSLILIKNKKVAEQGGAKLFSCGIYDYDNIMLIKEFLNQASKGIFFDVGANIGVYSILVSENPNNLIYSFEPHPVTFANLDENISVNKRYNIFAHQVAIGSEQKKVGFTNDDFSSLNKIISGQNFENSITVNQISLEQFIIDNNVLPDVIKIDVEGYEVEVLKGLKEKLSLIKLIIVENNNADTIKVLMQKDFQGPLYVDHKQKVLSNVRYYHEDPVYINKNTISLIENILSYKIVSSS